MVFFLQAIYRLLVVTTSSAIRGGHGKVPDFIKVEGNTTGTEKKLVVNLIPNLAIVITFAVLSYL